MHKPEKQFRIGAVLASVFLNDGPDGSFRTVAIQRRYHDGDEYRTSFSFPLNELPAAVAALNAATSYVISMEAESP